MTETSRIAFIQACWHKDIVDQARKSFVDEIGRLGYSQNTIDLYEVPGSLELPLQAQLLAKTGRYQIIVCAGLIIDGGIYRHEFVAAAVINGFMQAQLATEVPILSVVLTPQQFHNSEEHQKFFFEHFTVKGIEAALACVRTMENLNHLKSLPEADVAMPETIEAPEKTQAA